MKIQSLKFNIQRSAGFTLIELLIAIFILEVGIIGVLQTFPLGARIWRSSEMATVAVGLGQAKMEQIISQSYDEVPFGIIESKHQLDAPFSSYQRETEVVCVDPTLDFSEVVDCSPDPEIKKVTVVVFWRSSFGIKEKSIDLVSLIVKK